MNDRPPAPVRGLLEDQMWAGIRRHRMALPTCGACARAVYPPSSVCPRCLASDLPWKPLSGLGTIVSWTRFHRTYLPAYPAPHTVIAVALDEGAVMVSSFADGPPDPGDWIGKRVRMVYRQMGEDLVLPCFELLQA